MRYIARCTAILTPKLITQVLYNRMSDGYFIIRSLIDLLYSCILLLWFIYRTVILKRKRHSETRTLNSETGTPFPEPRVNIIWTSTLQCTFEFGRMMCLLRRSLYEIHLCRPDQTAHSVLI